MLVTSIFSFFHYVFTSLKQKSHHLWHLHCNLQSVFNLDTLKLLLFCKDLTLYYRMTTFDSPGEKKTENMVWKGAKGENAGYKHFLLFLCYNNVFYPMKGKFNVLTHSHTVTHFDAHGKQAFWKHCGKGEIACLEQFLLFPQCFLPFWKTFFHFCQIWNCRLQTLSIWKSLKFVVW